MNKQGVYILTIGLIALLVSACGGGVTKPSTSIPVVKMADISKAGKYFHTDKFYHDKALAPFSSISGVITKLSGQASANGSKAFLVTKSYEKRAKGKFMNGIYVFVEGWGITWKSADKKTLLSDLNTLVNKKNVMPVIQAGILIDYLAHKKVKEAIPLFLKAVVSLNFHRTINERFISAYFTLGDASQNNEYVKLINSHKSNIRQSAIQALSLYGTKKHKSIFIKILGAGSKHDGGHFAAEGLMKVGSKKDIGEWKKLLHFHPDDSVKMIAAKALLKYSQRSEVVELTKNTPNNYLKRDLEKLLLK